MDEELLGAVRLEADVPSAIPHELSGGMKQRVCIAMAILFGPQLIIADEFDQRTRRGVPAGRAADPAQGAPRSRTSIVLIGHDLAVQAQVADRIGIMFAGRLMEIGSTFDIFDDPRHPYTKRLIRSVPSIRRNEGIPDIPLPSEAEQEAGGARTVRSSRCRPATSSAREASRDRA